MNQFLSRYSPRYIRSLVYMLQASEYNVYDYLRWYHRTGDFRKVEYRKKLVKSPKAILLLVSGWCTLALGCFYAYLLGGVVLLVLAFLLSPFVLGYAIIIPLLCINLFQVPAEYILLARTRRTLTKHRGVKIAIAGSFGKTSIREILKTILAEGKKVAAPSGSHNTPLGIIAFVKSLYGDEEVLIFELGEYYPGDVRKLAGLIEPAWGVITGVNEAHLEKFKTLEATTATIFELADSLGSKPVYVNAENTLARNHARPEHILFSRTGVGEWKITEAHTDLEGTSFLMAKEDIRINAVSALLGLHMIGPIAVAIDIASRLGLSKEEIESGIRKTKPFAHRLERRDSDGVITLDDSYNGNPDGVAAVITFFGSLKGHRRFYVTPGLVEMGVRKEAVHREIGRELADAGIEHVILIRNSVTPFIEQGLQGASYPGTVTWFEDALQAYRALPRMTVSGDIVLLQNDWPDQYA